MNTLLLAALVCGADISGGYVPAAAAPVPAYTVYEFRSKTCVPCRLFEPTLAAWRAKYGARAVFRTVDVDEDAAGLAARYGVAAVPAVVVTDGKLYADLAGDRLTEARLRWALDLEPAPAAKAGPACGCSRLGDVRQGRGANCGSYLCPANGGGGGCPCTAPAVTPAVPAAPAVVVVPAAPAVVVVPAAADPCPTCRVKPVAGRR